MRTPLYSGFLATLFIDVYRDTRPQKSASGFIMARKCFYIHSVLWKKETPSDDRVSIMCMYAVKKLLYDEFFDFFKEVLSVVGVSIEFDWL